MSKHVHPCLRTLAVCVAVLSSMPPPVHAGQSEPLAAQWQHTHFSEQIRTAGRSAFRRAVETYDQQLTVTPDARLAVEKCRLLSAFAYDEDDTPLASSDDVSGCEEMLRGSYGDEPLALTYLFEQSWGDEARAEGERLLATSAEWPATLRARLHNHLAIVLSLVDEDEDGAGRHAVRAVELDSSAPAVLRAAKYLESVGARSRARAMLASATLDTLGGAAEDAVEMLVRLGDPAAAVRMAQEAHRENRILDLTAMATAMAAGGRVDDARRLFVTATEEATFSSTDASRAYFAFELTHGSPDQAAAAFDRLRASGFWSDPLARRRLELARRVPSAPWTLTDVGALLALAGVLLFCAALPLIVIAPVHYRGLVRRLHDALPVPPPHPWTLRHAWYAVGAMLVTSTLSLYLFAPLEVEAILDAAVPWADEPSDPRALGRAFMFSAATALLLLAPLLRGVRLVSLVEGQWPLRKSLNAAVVSLIGLRVVGGLLTSLMASGLALSGATSSGMRGIYDEYGWVALTLVAVIIVPVVEEFVFRGVLLNSLARHVSFWSAAIIQAVAFAVIHEQTVQMPYLFVMALLAAWLYRRSQGLAAPIALHVFNNALACWAIIRAAQVLDRSPF